MTDPRKREVPNKSDEDAAATTPRPGETTGSETAGTQKPSQIQVADFDSVRQASMWRQHGAPEATRRLLAVLRTAILLGDVLTIDRNQLFDGIFFLSLGPDGIARELGIGPEGLLPLKVKCQPESPEHAQNSEIQNRRVPALRGRAEGEGDLISVDFQLEKVRDPNFLKASSARMATMADAAENDWMCAQVGENWVRGAGLTNFHVELSDEQIEALIQESQEKWAQAIVDGRVAVDRWDRGATPGGPDVHAALNDSFEELESDGQRRPLADFVLNEKANFRRQVTGRVFEWMTDAEGEPNTRELSDRARQSDTTWDEARMAMDMWSRGYYRAIANQDGAMYLSFYDNSFAVENRELAGKYGLTLPRRSALKRMRDRAFTSRRAETVRVEGEVLDHMLVISPPVFSQLYPLTRDAARRLIREGDQQAMFDIAYAAREAVSAPETHSRRRFVTFMRVATMTLLAVVIAGLGLFMDLTDLSRRAQLLSIVVAGILGIIAGLPWDDMAELFRLRKSAMTATLTMSNEGINHA